MSTLAGGAAYPAFKFDNVGKTVSGRIVGIDVAPVLDYNSRQPRTWKNGKPMEQTVISLEQVPGDESSRVSVYVFGARIERAIKEAFKAAGRTDIEVGDDLSLTQTGWETTDKGQQAKTFTAKYAAA